MAHPAVSKHSYLFIILGEVGPIHFIHSHDYGHHVLPIHYGRSQDVLSLVLCEGVHEVTEMLILKENKDKREWVEEEQRQESNPEPQVPMVTIVIQSLSPV